jgi:4,5-DOPA dioxygenase extradiol
MPDPLPTLFLSHGAPDVVLRDTPASGFLRGLAATLPRPRAIVVASAHWEEDSVTVETGRTPATIHDFGGFPAELYRQRYPAPGDNTLAARIGAMLTDAGLKPRTRERGFDHGVWTPLILAWPAADIPVVPVSLIRDGGADKHLRIGQALASLRTQGVLVIGSGSAVHNLGVLAAPGQPPAPWATAFDDWLVKACTAGDTAALTSWLTTAPDARYAQPNPDHFMPLFVALGAAGPNPKGRVLHRSWDYGSLAMTSFAFA